jgi:DNA-binding transcriptional MerR regulator
MPKRSSLPPKMAQGTLPAVDADAAGWEEIGFRGPQVCGIVGISYRQLDYWARTDLLRPSLAEAQGSGTQRRYSYRDLVALKVIKSLLDAGVALKTARKAIAYLREHLGGDLAAASLVLDGSRSVLARTGDDIVDLVRHGQGVLNIIPLGPVVAELDASIHELGAADAEPVEEKPARKRARAAGGG